MNLFAAVLIYLGYILIFPGFVFSGLAGLLLLKVVHTLRQVICSDNTATIQPFNDFFLICRDRDWLLNKEEKERAILPAIGFAVLAVVQLCFPVCGFIAFPGVADAAVIMFALFVPAAAEVFGSPKEKDTDAMPFLRIIPVAVVFFTVCREVGNITGEGFSFDLETVSGVQVSAGSLIMRPAMFPAAMAMLLAIASETADLTDGRNPFAVLMHGEKLLVLSGMFVALFLGGIGFGIMTADMLIYFVMCAFLTAVTAAAGALILKKLNTKRLQLYGTAVITGFAAVSFVFSWMGL